MNEIELENRKNPWENRREIGFFKAVVSTVKMLLFAPKDFYGKFAAGNSLKEPYLFYLTVQTPIMILGFVLFGYQQLQDEKFAGMEMFLYPLLLVFFFGGIFVTTAFMHFFIKLFRGEGHYYHTFYILAYADTATAVFNLIPFIGGFIRFGWLLLIAVIGYRCIHKMSAPRAVMAYLGLTILMPLLVGGIIAAQTYAQRSLQSRIRDAEQSLGTLPPAKAEDGLKHMGNAVE